MISISIVEDHELYRISLVTMINENKNFKINNVYSSAEAALETFTDNPPDIALIDIELKDMSGIEFILRTKNKVPNTQFLMCTGYQNNENVFNALKAGASGYIVKGSSANEIQSAITELYNGGAPMSPYIARKVINLLHKKSDLNDYNLSERELQVLSLLSKGLLYKEISEILNISFYTVKNHCKNIYKRLHVQNKTEALNKYHSF